jgi:hypothetical protein
MFRIYCYTIFDISRDAVRRSLLSVSQPNWILDEIVLKLRVALSSIFFLFVFVFIVLAAMSMFYACFWFRQLRARVRARVCARAIWYRFRV